MSTSEGGRHGDGKVGAAPEDMRLPAKEGRIVPSCPRYRCRALAMGDDPETATARKGKSGNPRHSALVKGGNRRRESGRLVIGGRTQQQGGEVVSTWAKA